MPRGRRQQRDRRPMRPDNTNATHNHPNNGGILDHKPYGMRMAVAAEMREYSTNHGAALELAAIAPDISQDRFCAVIPGGGMWGATTDIRDITYAAQQVSQPGKTVCYQIFVRDDNKISRAKRDGCPVRITANDGRRPRDDVDRGFVQEMVEQRLSPPDRDAIRMVKYSQPIVARPAFGAPPIGQSSHQQHPLQPQSPSRQVKKEEAPEKTNTVPDPKKVNPLNPIARRQYMDACFQQLPISTDMIEQARIKAIELQSKHLSERGLSDVNVVYFEYHVDVTIWRLIMNRLKMTKFKPWPWTVSLDENNLSEGTSPIFREWCRSHASSAEAQGSISETPHSQAQLQGPAPLTFDEARSMAREARERVNRDELEAFRLERIVSEWAFDDEAFSAVARVEDSPDSFKDGAMKRKFTGSEDLVTELPNDGTSVAVESKRPRLDSSVADDPPVKPTPTATNVNRDGDDIDNDIGGAFEAGFEEVLGSIERPVNTLHHRLLSEMSEFRKGNLELRESQKLLKEDQERQNELMLSMQARLEELCQRDPPPNVRQNIQRPTISFDNLAITSEDVLDTPNL
ncbi:hypothetical protein FGADI_12493 [Fusarium gaditjirri]|uniref:Uncharacterized protein n=1 Tax=Fusarium gaditjirri TaxID=282569 RepID=A0A8H4WNA4_9HYPO|nr:hypothetical protein FGADI_12493 [Fusarium gaditjirri]